MTFTDSYYPDSMDYVEFAPQTMARRPAKLKLNSSCFRRYRVFFGYTLRTWKCAVAIIELPSADVASAPC